MITLDGFLQEVYFNEDNDDEDLRALFSREIVEKLQEIKNKVGKIYFVNEQRLIIEKYNNLNDQNTINVINELPNKFKQILLKISNDYSVKANELDRSYPNRLFSNESAITEEQYNKKMGIMDNKFLKLMKYDLSSLTKPDGVVFKDEHAKALKIYFDDFDEKYKVYEDMIFKLDLYTDIVNSRLNFKYIKISRNRGIEIFDIDNENKNISLQKLSSGEKQVIILFYELIFESENSELLLIDEPEISLHIAWQKRFMDDLLRIVEYKKISVVVATHSPQIINNHWDKQIDLGEVYGN